MDGRRSTIIVALIIPLTIGSPAWGQAAKNSASSPRALQPETGSQLVPAAQPPFDPRPASAPGVLPNAQPLSQPPGTIAAGADSSGATQDSPISEPNQQRKPREGQTARDSAAAALNRQELSRITGGGGYRIVRDY